MWQGALAGPLLESNFSFITAQSSNPNSFVKLRLWQLVCLIVKQRYLLFHVGTSTLADFQPANTVLPYKAPTTAPAGAPKTLTLAIYQQDPSTPTPVAPELPPGQNVNDWLGGLITRGLIDGVSTDAFSYTITGQCHSWSVLVRKGPWKLHYCITLCCGPGNVQGQMPHLTPMPTLVDVSVYV